MTQYQEILNNLRFGKCNYRNEKTGVSYSIGQVLMKICSDGSLKFFGNIESMARSINKFIKTGY